MEPTTIREITIRLNDLETLIISIQNSMQNSLALLVSILGVAIAIAGIGFFQLLKSDVIKKYEKHIDEQEKRITGKIIEVFNNQKTEWFYSTLLNGHTSFQNEKFAFRKISDSTLALKGRVILGSSEHIAILPRDFRPSKSILVSGLITTHEIDEFRVCTLSIGSNGSISVLGWYRTGAVVIFDNLIIDLSV
jgi:hypothetical protein